MRGPWAWLQRPSKGPGPGSGSARVSPVWARPTQRATEEREGRWGAIPTAPTVSALSRTVPTFVMCARPYLKSRERDPESRETSDEFTRRSIEHRREQDAPAPALHICLLFTLDVERPVSGLWCRVLIESLVFDTLYHFRHFSLFRDQSERSHV